MILQIGQHVKCWFHNNTIIEGIVESWSDKEAVLKSLSDESQFIITNTSDDIMFVKTYPTLSKQHEIKNELENKLQEVYQEPSEDQLRIKKIAALKIMLAQQEKKIVSEKLKNHNIGAPQRIVKYGYLGFIPKQNS